MSRLGGPAVLNFYQTPLKYNYHFCYVNCNRNYLINCVDKLFKDQVTTMFANQETYVIHNATHTCGTDENKNEPSKTLDECYRFLKDSYPKNQILKVVVKILIQNNLLNENLFFKLFPRIHLADFCSHINNKFDKKFPPDKNMLKLCKYLQNQKINFPLKAVKNPMVQKYLT